MLDEVTRMQIEALHDAPWKYVLALAGGGTQAAGVLLKVPGGSRTILEVVVPYSEQALAEFLGGQPEQACSAATSQAMARRALQRARWLAPGEAVIGVGCTASLASDRPKRGDHRFHIAIQTSERVTTYSLTLCKGARERSGEEALLDCVLLNALAEAFGIGTRLPTPLLAEEVLALDMQPTAGVLGAVIQGQLAAVCAEVDGRLRVDAPRPRLLLCGSFNPLHDGHWNMATVASRMIGQPAAFELSVTNVDKPLLAIEELYRRLAQFSWRAPVWLTRAPTFSEKASLFPSATFVIGADTAARIVEPRHYEKSEARMAEALGHFRAQGCRFLVAGRVDGSRRFVGLEDLAIPAEYRDLLSGIAETAFRVDISSTQLRSLGSR